MALTELKGQNTGTTTVVIERGPVRVFADALLDSDPVYRQGVLWVAVWFAVGVLYFAIRGRHKLILSPEEEFAMSHKTG